MSLSNLLDEVRRLSGIVRKLLLLSLADAGQMNLHRVEVDLSSLLMEMLEDIELLAPHLEIQSEIADGLRVQGDRGSWGRKYFPTFPTFTSRKTTNH